MIYIEPKEPGLEWDDWKEKAARETQELIDDAVAGKPLKFKQTIWKKLKPFLLKQFHEKCGYCEGKYIAGSSLDVEHFRPKGKVTDYRDENKTVMIEDKDGNEIDHPGYYWLAYNWRNLLLSCEKCNRGDGKCDQFPISGTRATSPGDRLEAEKPLLLNPYEDNDIDEHIAFGVKGIIAGKTERGRQTISICNLNRAELQNARQEEFEKMKKVLGMNLFFGGDEKLFSKEMQFTAYIKSAFMEYVKTLPREIERRT